MTRSKWVLVIIIVAGLLAVALWSLDFRVAWSENRNDSQTSTFASGTGDNRREGVQRQYELALYVEGDDALSDALRHELIKSLGDGSIFHKVLTLAAMREKLGQPVLVVEVDEGSNPWASIWTPVYSRAALVANVVFASDGDTSWRGHSPVVMPGDGQRTVWIEGSIEIRDTTKGLISHTAYRKHLGQRVAVAVSKALEQALVNQPL